nr:hypothetical protein HK105_002228 [Polyrhizophydium stewartii]
MRLGMRKKAEERARKKLQEAKDMGMYHSSLRTQIMGSDFVQKSDKDRRKKRSDVGIIGSIGRIKDGVMHVSKKHIDSVNSPGGSARGKRRRGAGAGDPTASLSVSGGRRGKSGGRSSKRTRLGF